jgi:pimeloyl-ACP methyl ester carboxylesterase
MDHDTIFHPSPYVFVHGSAGAGAQWGAMAALLRPGEHCLYPDLVGYGSGARFERGSYRFQHEIAIVEKALQASACPSVLVGHSFGGVVALATAIARPELVTRLVLIEPVAFTFLDGATHGSSWQRVIAFCDHIGALVQRGRHGEAAETFFDFWELGGLWHALGDKRKKVIELAMPKVAAECALVHAPVFTAADIAHHLSTPTLVLRGSASPRLARDVCALVADASPCCTLADLPGADHMSPMLRPQEVLAAIREFCARVDYPSRAGMVAQDHAPALPRGEVTALVV